MNREINADIIVIGGGPAGIAAAIECRRLGAQRVVVIERETDAGGVPRHCGHPPFGMWEFKRILTGPAYARRLVQAAIDAGVDIRTRHHVVAMEPHGSMRLTTPQGLVSAKGKRVIVATGARETPRSVRLVSGQRPWGVMNTGALQSHLYLHGLTPFLTPIIVGTELVALSAVLSCLKAGIRPAAVVEVNARPTARWPLTLFPSLCGVPVYYETSVEDIHGSARVTSATLVNRAGDRREVSCDGVLFTGNFVPEASLVRASHLQLDPLSGGPKIDQFGCTSDTAYYAAGNLLRPVETAGWSYREGIRIARFAAASLAQTLPELQDDEAPAPRRGVEVQVGPGLKYVVPSHLSLDCGPGMKTFQLRVAAPITGILEIKVDGEVTWRKRVSASPERRILVPIPQLASGTRTVSIGFSDATHTAITIRQGKANTP